MSSYLAYQIQTRASSKVPLGSYSFTFMTFNDTLTDNRRINRSLLINRISKSIVEPRSELLSNRGAKKRKKAKSLSDIDDNCINFTKKMKIDDNSSRNNGKKRQNSEETPQKSKIAPDFTEFCEKLDELIKESNQKYSRENIDISKGDENPLTSTICEERTDRNDENNVNEIGQNNVVNEEQLIETMHCKDKIEDKNEEEKGNIDVNEEELRKNTNCEEGTDKTSNRGQDEGEADDVNEGLKKQKEEGENNDGNKEELIETMICEDKLDIIEEKFENNDVNEEKTVETMICEDKMDKIDDKHEGELRKNRNCEEETDRDQDEGESNEVNEELRRTTIGEEGLDTIDDKNEEERDNNDVNEEELRENTNCEEETEKTDNINKDGENNKANEGNRSSRIDIDKIKLSDQQIAELFDEIEGKLNAIFQEDFKKITEKSSESIEHELRERKMDIMSNEEEEIDNKIIEEGIEETNKTSTAVIEEREEGKNKETPKKKKINIISNKLISPSIKIDDEISNKSKRKLVMDKVEENKEKCNHKTRNTYIFKKRKHDLSEEEDEPKKPKRISSHFSITSEEESSEKEETMTQEPTNIISNKLSPIIKMSSISDNTKRKLNVVEKNKKKNTLDNYFFREKKVDLNEECEEDEPSDSKSVSSHFSDNSEEENSKKEEKKKSENREDRKLRKKLINKVTDKIEKIISKEKRKDVTYGVDVSVKIHKMDNIEERDAELSISYKNWSKHSEEKDETVEEFNENISQDCVIDENLDQSDDTPVPTLENIKIDIPWPVSPLHKIETRVGKLPSNQEREKMKNLGIEIKSGNFSKEEDTKIGNNFEKFCQLHNLPTDSAPFLNLLNRKEGHLSYQERVKFVRFLGHGLENRTLFSIYKRFQRLYLKKKIKTGRFTDEEDEIIRNYMKNPKSRPFLHLAKVLNRERTAVHKRYKLLMEKDEVDRVKWTNEKMKNCLKNLLEVTGCTNIDELKDRKITNEEWKVMAEKMKMPVESIRQAWHMKIYIRTFMEESLNTAELKEKLLDCLSDKDWHEIDWDEVAKEFKGCTVHYLKALVQRMVKKHVPREKQDNLKECLAILRDNGHTQRNRSLLKLDLDE